MSRQANPTLIGLFVVAGFSLAVGAFIVISSLRLFARELTCIIYFDESVSNLNLGAPVKFKGVPVGKVKDVRIKWNQDESDDAIPVFITLDLTRLTKRLGVQVNVSDSVAFEEEVRKGMRGRLQMESFVTGLLFVDLNYFDDPGRPVLRQIEPLYPEIPSLPSDLEKLGQSTTNILAKIASLDVKSLSDNLNTLLKTANQEIQGADLPALTLSLRHTSDSLQATSESVRSAIQDVRLQETVAILNETLRQLKQLAARLESRLDGVADQTEALQVEMRNTLTQVRNTLDDVQAFLAPESSTRYALDKLLEDLSRTALAARQLLETLEQNPRVLLTGKPLPETP